MLGLGMGQDCTGRLHIHVLKVWRSWRSPQLQAVTLFPNIFIRQHLKRLNPRNGTARSVSSAQGDEYLTALLRIGRLMELVGVSGLQLGHTSLCNARFRS